jgi:hypothetical protein
METRPRKMVVCAVLCIAFASCGGEESRSPVADVPEAEQSIEREEGGLLAGELGVVYLGGDSLASGIVIFLESSDGERSPALFRGPPQLAKVFTGGDFLFALSDSLPPRVRLLGAGETIQMAPPKGPLSP